ncbi:hypothetical protein [Arthrobacter sp. Y-9]|uniref:hypothetical protein n=1 Tax=Arthrobacter sp. Y-9 TaxID=3039385 RepID=UPI00241CA580|nr:hypothetical protein [Arthrobacter sp. Y-9]WFR84576.1 hypothetical protein P9849_02710 [Arthrobacter sp. Y-9]
MSDVTGPQQCWRNLSLLGFSTRWIYAWRALDMETISTLVQENIEFHCASKEASAPLRGVSELLTALADPDFRWDLAEAIHLKGLITAENMLVIDYRDEAGTSFTESLEFLAGRVSVRRVEVYAP